MRDGDNQPTHHSGHREQDDGPPLSRARRRRRARPHSCQHRTGQEHEDRDDEDAAEMLASTGQTESGLNQLARIGFDTLGLQTYLTAGPKETRAWTIPKGAKAPQAAGVIHTDFEKGFIKAEIVSFEDLVETGSVVEARAKGKARLEGKDYVMQDGDVVEFRFNV